MNSKTIILGDTECLPNYWLARFFDPITKQRVAFELYDGYPLDRATLAAVMETHTTVGFNWLAYDQIMILAATAGYDNAQLKALSDHVINSAKVGVRHWQIARDIGLVLPQTWDMIDLIEPVPGVRISQKLYAARMHSRTVLDMPIHHDTVIMPEQRPEVLNYCDNDIDNLHDMWTWMQEPMALRVAMSKEYGVDLRSKSDAQIAEAVIKAEVMRLTGNKLYAPKLPDNYAFQYKAPAFIKFHSPELNEIKALIEAQVFTLKKNGSPAMPAALSRKVIKIGGSSYKIGLGGLHSQETSVSYWADELHEINDDDVTGYYPSLMLICRLMPPAIGELFLSIFKSIVERRVSAKHKGAAIKKAIERIADSDMGPLTEFGVTTVEQAKKLAEQLKVAAEGLKISANGLYGKLGSRFSVVYTPDQLLMVTLTGQLSLLMLIEMLERIGIRVISANTDGIVTLVPRHLNGVKAAVITAWESLTGLSTENTGYRSIHSRDVNSYVAVKLDGKIKGKGDYGNPWAEKDIRGIFMKSPARTVCVEAVHAYLSKGTPVEETIAECRDIRKFVLCQSVNGGGGEVVDDDDFETEYIDDWVAVGSEKKSTLWMRQLWLDTDPTRKPKKSVMRPAPVEVAKKREDSDSEDLGRVARWYWAADSDLRINYIGNARKVAKSDGCKPIMTLPDTLPGDIDYPRYINEAREMLAKMGIDLSKERQQCVA